MVLDVNLLNEKQDFISSNNFHKNIYMMIIVFKSFYQWNNWEKEKTGLLALVACLSKILPGNKKKTNRKFFGV